MRLTTRKTQNQSFEYGDLKRHLWRVNWKTEGYPYCGVYCVSPDNGWPTKIGISQNPAKRLLGIQTGVWKRVDIVGYRYCHNFKDAREIEKKVHSIFREENLSLHGEWFDVRADKAVDAIEFAALTLGLDLMAEVPDEKIKFWISNFLKREGHKDTMEFMDGLDAKYGSDGVYTYDDLPARSI